MFRIKKIGQLKLNFFFIFSQMPTLPQSNGLSFLKWYFKHWRKMSINHYSLVSSSFRTKILINFCSGLSIKNIKADEMSFFSFHLLWKNGSTLSCPGQTFVSGVAVTGVQVYFPAESFFFLYHFIVPSPDLLALNLPLRYSMRPLK